MYQQTGQQLETSIPNNGVQCGPIRSHNNFRLCPPFPVPGAHLSAPVPTGVFKAPLPKNGVVDPLTGISNVVIIPRTQKLPVRQIPNNGYQTREYKLMQKAVMESPRHWSRPAPYRAPSKRTTLPMKNENYNPAPMIHDNPKVEFLGIAAPEPRIQPFSAVQSSAPYQDFSKLATLPMQNQNYNQAPLVLENPEVEFLGIVAPQPVTQSFSPIPSTSSAPSKKSTLPIQKENINPAPVILGKPEVEFLGVVAPEPVIQPFSVVPSTSNLIQPGQTELVKQCGPYTCTVILSSNPSNFLFPRA